MKNIVQIEKYKIVQTNYFMFELDNIIHYIFYNLKEQYIAIKKYKKINKEINRLNKFPKRCPIVHGCKEEIRKLIFDNYIVIFQINYGIRSNNYFTHISFKTKLFK